jgi:hypothetical protein
MDDIHYFRLGYYVTKVAADDDMSQEEKGRVIAGYYLILDKAAERDARDRANGKSSD